MSPHVSEQLITLAARLSGEKRHADATICLFAVLEIGRLIEVIEDRENKCARAKPKDQK